MLVTPKAAVRLDRVTYVYGPKLSKHWELRALEYGGARGEPFQHYWLIGRQVEVYQKGSTDKAKAVLLPVGKRCGKSSSTQQFINQQLVRAAQHA